MTSDDRRAARCMWCYGRKTIVFVTYANRRTAAACFCTVAHPPPARGIGGLRRSDPNAKHGRKGRTPKGFISGPGGRHRRAPARRRASLAKWAKVELICRQVG